MSEMLKVIDTLMTEEFERYSSADLNRPLIDSQPDILEEVTTTQDLERNIKPPEHVYTKTIPSFH